MAPNRSSSSRTARTKTTGRTRPDRYRRRCSRGGARPPTPAVPPSSGRPHRPANWTRGRPAFAIRFGSRTRQDSSEIESRLTRQQSGPCCTAVKYRNHGGRSRVSPYLRSRMAGPTDLRDRSAHSSHREAEPYRTCAISGGQSRSTTVRRSRDAAPTRAAPVAAATCAPSLPPMAALTKEMSGESGGCRGA